MNIFGCCPKKPKMTLDYVIKWVEETDKTLKEVVAWKQEIEEDDLKSLFDEYASSYPWGEVPAFDAKVDKVENATTGDFAALNDAGNITDSGYKASSFAPATHYHTLLRLASQRETSEYNQIALGEQEQQGVISIRLYDASIDDSVFSDVITASQLNNIFYPATAPVQGNQKLITSSAVFTALQGKADSEHYHSTITNQASGGRVALFEVDATSKTAILELNDGTIYKSAEINMNNIDNLNRALETPATQPASGSNKLITSGAVYNYIPRAISNVGYGVSVDEDGEISIGSDYVVISVDGGGEAEINSENIANLNRALRDPEAPTQGSNNLITSGQVYSAIKQAHLTLCVDSNHYPVDGKQDVIADLDDLLSNFESDTLYNCIITYKNITSSILNTDGYAGMCRWEFKGYDSQSDSTEWYVYLYIGDKTLYTKCAVQGEATKTEWENDGWVDWNLREMGLS